MTDDVLPHIKWRIEVEPGVEIPDGYGIVRFDIWRNRAICMPVPINLIVAAWEGFVRWLRFPPWVHSRRRDAIRIADAWDEGYIEAYWQRDAGVAMERINPYRTHS